MDTKDTLTLIGVGIAFLGVISRIWIGNWDIIPILFALFFILIVVILFRGK